MMNNKKNLNKDRLSAEKWVFDLFIAGKTPNCKLAFENLKNFCEKELPHHHRINVIDILLHPDSAEKHNIIAIPVVIKTAPKPIQYIIGDFSDYEQMLRKLGLKKYKV